MCVCVRWSEAPFLPQVEVTKGWDGHYGKGVTSSSTLTLECVCMCVCGVCEADLLALFHVGHDLWHHNFGKIAGNKTNAF